MKIKGLKVVDATNPVDIHITTKDVQTGGVKDPFGCAAAKACVRDLKVTEAKVHLGRVYLRKSDRWVRYMTPQSLRTEIIAFDRGGGFDAGDYTLKPPSPATQLGYRKPTGPKKTRNRQKIKPRHVVVGIRPHAEHERK